MRRVPPYLVLALLLVACRGPEGPPGAAGTQGPPGPQGPAGSAWGTPCETSTATEALRAHDSPAPEVAVAADPYVGEVMLIPYPFAPRGWMEARGQLLSMSENQALFSLLGTTYGGDGRTTFALPDMRGLEPRCGMRWVIAVQGIYPSRS